MPTTLLLIRHARHDRPGPHLVGRDDGVGLSPEGVADARQLGDRLAGIPLAALLTSPSRRCRETADILAAPHALRADVDAGFDELDFGAWRGRSFAELAADATSGPEWARFNTARGSARIPGGETILAVAARVGDGLARAAQRAPGGLAAVVTHADVIRTALATALGLAPDLMLRLAIDPGSVSVLSVGGDPQVLAVNWRPDRPLPASAAASSGHRGCE